MAFIKKAAALIIVLIMTIGTVILATTTFTQGGWWILALVVWLPIFGVLCAVLGHPIDRKSKTHEPDPFIID